GRWPTGVDGLPASMSVTNECDATFRCTLTSEIVRGTGKDVWDSLASNCYERSQDLTQRCPEAPVLCPAFPRPVVCCNAAMLGSSYYTDADQLIKISGRSPSCSSDDWRTRLTGGEEQS